MNRQSAVITTDLVSLASTGVIDHRMSSRVLPFGACIWKDLEDCL